MALEPVSVEAFSYFVRSDLRLRLHESVKALKTSLSRTSRKRLSTSRAGL